MIAPMRGAGRDRQMAEESAAPFSAGDRVVIRQQWSDSLILPMRKWAEEGRRGTVRNCFTPQGGREFIVIVQFDSKRKPKSPDNFVMQCRPDDLQMAGSA
jgi:hypothetical protein